MGKMPKIITKNHRQKSTLFCSLFTQNTRRSAGMAVILYPHNQKAYRNVLQLLEQSDRAAVIHPTGTGKSFIAFKLAEEHPGEKMVWLAPSEYIFRSQRENYLAAGGEENALEGITFLTYSKLLYSMQETEEGTHKIPDMKEAEKPSYIILDEFHRCGADGWGKGVEQLLEMCPGAKVLGLSATNIRYLDNRRDMAEELFGGQIASKMELTEAMAGGILPTPLYICGLYEYKDQLRRLVRRVNRQRNAGVQSESTQLLEKLRHCLEQADGPAEIFARYMKKDGKYIVFCSGREHMEKMITLTGQWYGALDKNPTIYRAIYDNEESPQEVRNFSADQSGHLKLLFCIDMLNEGVHVADVDGAVLLRPTASPTLYLQQVGRALSVPDRNSGKQPMIFDMVDNFDSLKCVDSFLEAYHRADSVNGREKEQNAYEFRLIDEARESRELFERLNKSLGSSWEMCYQEAKSYFELHGNIKVPKNYITENGISLGSWLITQRRVRAGAVPGSLTKEQIQLLDELGMVWESRVGRAWETGYQELVKYYEEYGNVDVLSRYVTEDGYPLGKFVANQRQAWKNSRLEKGIGGRRLLPERERRLNELGFLWEKPKKAPEDKDSNGGNKYDARWNEKFRLAEQYYREHGNLEVPREYTVQGVRLGRWVNALRSARICPGSSHYRLDEERIRSLDRIGMRWGGESWEVRYHLAELYYQEHGDLKISQSYVTETKEERIWLGKWLAAQRKKRNHPGGRHDLTEEQEKRLEAIGMEW